MRRINRVANYFEYSNEHPSFKVRAFNDDNKQVRLMISERDSLQFDLYFIHVNSTPQQVTYLLRQDVNTETSFNIIRLTDGVYACSIYGIRRTDGGNFDLQIFDTADAFDSIEDLDDLFNTSSSENGSFPYERALLGQFDFDCGSEDEFTKVRMERAGLTQTDDDEFWKAIKKHQLNFKQYFQFINHAMYRPSSKFNSIDPRNTSPAYINAERRSNVFVGINEYQMLKMGTEFYMLKLSALDENQVTQYMPDRLPYFEHLSDTYESADAEYPDTPIANRIKQTRFKTPFFIELIWSYWMEQGMLMQTMNLINLRFQNMSIGNGVANQLARFDLSPLRPLSHLLWGFIQDEQHRLSLPRRVQEYDHEYGLTLPGRAAQAYAPADSRSKFLEAFHNLLTTASIYYKEADDTTRIADAFPVLNCLKEVHLLLAEGNHNAYGNLTWTARHEMMMTQYLIARDETRVFLGGRPMVPYPEEWMDRVDTMRSMMGWGGTSITYFYDLAIHGEKLLLSVRYGDWSDANMPAVNAANWALSFRDSVQKYMHGYRTVTGADLSADAAVGGSAMRSLQPSLLIQRRVQEERSRIQRRA